MARGEITLVIAGAPTATPSVTGTTREPAAQAQLERTVQAALEHLPASKAAALAAEACQVPRAEAYALAVRLAQLRR
jgi:16S rRNA C1402 (ribose-2'-O) methylase RsmI